MDNLHGKFYSNNEITIHWQPQLCKHTGICFRGLPQVFDPRRRPWILPEASGTEEIIRQVKACPSGALSLVDKKI
ncbi:(4Fe-4S)-binding protein [soil metagenome]